MPSDIDLLTSHSQLSGSLSVSPVLENLSFLCLLFGLFIKCKCLCLSQTVQNATLASLPFSLSLAKLVED